MISWQFLVGLVTGGLGLRVIDYLILLSRERREQKNSKITQEKDRPRFRIDTSKVPTSHAGVPALVVKILSLGSLPLTINDGNVFIEAQHYPERVEPQKLNNREISPVHPIECRFSLPQKLINPMGIGEPHVKLVCEFSYGKDNGRYKEEKTYNHRSGEFE